MTDEIPFEDWLEQTQKKRDELAEYGRSPLPADASERHHDLDRSIQFSDDASRLLADADSYLSQADALAVFQARDKHPDLTAGERRVIAKNAVRDIQRLVAGLETTNRTIKSRIITNLNANRSR